MDSSSVPSLANVPPAASPPRPRLVLRNVLLLALPALAIAGSVFGYVYLTAERAKQLDLQPRVLRYVAGVTSLDPEFKDSDGDLVADRPEKTLDPDKLIFLTLETDAKVWSQFCTHLQKRVKKPIEWRPFSAELPEIVSKFKSGEVHIASCGTGTVPTLVNAAGFVPDFCMANAAGEYSYNAEILVAASSPIQSVKDLKGRLLTLGSMRSLSGFKAPIQALDGAGLVMGKDYNFTFSRGQRDSIEGLAAGRYEAVAVAGDLVHRLVANRKIDEKAFRTIYRSAEGFPPACFGHHHALKKELADEICKSFIEYSWDENLKKEFSPAGYNKFVPVSYAKDWAPVRKIDEQINRFLAGK